MKDLFRKIKNLFINRREIDTDRDGLSDFDEINIYHTNPYDADTDKDGIPDGEEIRRGRNPLGPGTLKNLFIPNIHNDYQSRILHPRRLFFYAASAVVMKIVIAGFVVLFPAGAWLTPDLMVQESKRVIELTNQIRQRQSIPVLRENSLLTQAAFNKSQDMLIKQYFAHVGPDGVDLSAWVKNTGYRYLVAGENLAMGFANADEVVTAWTKSRTHYANLIDTDYEEIGVGMASGPYSGLDTTMVAQYFALSSGPAVPAEEPKNQVVEAIVPTPTPEPEPTPTPDVQQEVLPEKVAEPVVEPAPTPEPEPIPVVVEPKPAPTPVVVEPAPDPAPIPKPKPIVVEPKPAPTPVVVEPAPTPEPEPIPVVVEVVPEVIEPVLASPKFIIYQNSLTEHSQASFIVYAPEAQRVMILNNGNKIAEKQSLQSEFFDFDLSLNPGEYNLVAKSFKDNLESVSPILAVNVVDVAPSVNTAESKIVISQPTGQTEDIVMAQIYLSGDAQTAEITIENHRIELSKEVGETRDGFNLWTGELIVFSSDHKDFFNTVTLPVLAVKDATGNELVQDIEWESIVPAKPSLTRQYLFMKSYPLKQVDLLFDISAWYYRLILIIAVIALALNVFIEIKKQYPHIIASTLGLISLMVLFIIV